MDASEPRDSPPSPALSCVYRANGQIDLSADDVATVELIGLAQHSTEDRVVFVQVFLDLGTARYYRGGRDRHAKAKPSDLGLHVFTESTYDTTYKRAHVQRVSQEPNLVQVLKRIHSTDADGVLPLVLTRNADQKSASSAPTPDETSAAELFEDSEQIVLAVNRYFARESRLETVIGFPIDTGKETHEQSATAS